MKKIILASLLAMSYSLAANLDTNKIQMYWESYKTSLKVPVKGSFADIKYKFGKQDGISGALLGATAKINLGTVITGNPTSEQNLTQGFFQHFASKDIRVKIEQVMEGKDQGTLLAKITMNKKSQLIPMQYTIKEGTLVAKGVLDVRSFRLDQALESLAKLCESLHEGFTWSQVEIGFTIPLK
ncbi:YceI family protein [Helicobacter pametensis]|uniref:YceI family protein n=1 Tax=Helicobacter pametensis TaxID=95149 RepID=UPI000482BA68|nr:YceI family protein [Helicobacter pametensis]